MPYVSLLRFKRHPNPQEFAVAQAIRSNQRPRPCYRRLKDIVVPTTAAEDPHATRYIEKKLDSVHQQYTILSDDPTTGQGAELDSERKNDTRPGMDYGVCG